jgi:beta-fructofuranosidase
VPIRRRDAKITPTKRQEGHAVKATFDFDAPFGDNQSDFGSAFPKRIARMAAPLCVVLFAAVIASPETKETTNEAAHAVALADANAAIERATPQAARDPLRPIYHVMAAARFINDPNGPVYFNSEYHVFFQHLPYWSERPDFGRPVWGHAVSTDLVHWRHLPIALAPTPDSYDAEAIASGCCVVDRGTPTIVYTGVGNGKQTQCLATSTDNLCTWHKDPANPVIPERPALEGLEDGFRDPCAWREGDEWRLLAGSGFKGRGGTVLLYRSTDLHHWDFLGPLCTGMGERCFQWECPAFFPLGGKHVLIVSPLYHDAPGLRGMVEYAVGNYRDNHFEPGQWRPVDLGGPTVFYAPNTFEDPHGRRILWGWIMADRPAESGWSHCLTLPRVLSLTSDGQLGIAPAPELTALRQNEHVRSAMALEPGQEQVLEPAFGLHGEIAAEIDLQEATRVELRLGRSADGARYVAVAYDASAGRLSFGDKQADFRLTPGEKALNLRLFVDGCIGEAYVNGRACFSNLLPIDPASTGISLIAQGGTARAARVAYWELKRTWIE